MLFSNVIYILSVLIIGSGAALGQALADGGRNRGVCEPLVAPIRTVWAPAAGEAQARCVWGEAARANNGRVDVHHRHGMRRHHRAGLGVDRPIDDHVAHRGAHVGCGGGKQQLGARGGCVGLQSGRDVRQLSGVRGGGPRLPRENLAAGVVDAPLFWLGYLGVRVLFVAPFLSGATKTGAGVGARA